MKLTVNYDTDHQVWFAFDGATADESNWIGQGSTAEAACSDYWYQAHGKVADLSQDRVGGWWVLSQGCHNIHFTTTEQAIAFADQREWQII